MEREMSLSPIEDMLMIRKPEPSRFEPKKHITIKQQTADASRKQESRDQRIPTEPPVGEIRRVVPLVQPVVNPLKKLVRRNITEISEFDSHAAQPYHREERMSSEPPEALISIHEDTQQPSSYRFGITPPRKIEPPIAERQRDGYLAQASSHSYGSPPHIEVALHPY